MYIYGYMVVWFSRSVGSSSLLPHVACQAPLSLGFLRQKYWSGLPFPSPGDLPKQGMEPTSPALQAVSSFPGAFFTVKPPGKEITCNVGDLCSIPGREDPLEKGMAAHSVFLPGEPHGQRSLGGLWLQSMGSRSQTQLSN